MVQLFSRISNLIPYIAERFRKQDTNALDLKTAADVQAIIGRV